MPPPRIAIATCSEYPDLVPDDPLLCAALAARGLRPEVVVWDAGEADWGGFDACLLRSVWDYHRKPVEFGAWVRAVAEATRLWNPPQLIAWNAEKTYLRDLAAAGVPTVPTLWVEPGDDADLGGLLAARGWEEAVVKPTVDLGALNLRRVRADESGAQAALDGVLARHGAMVQPFLPSLQTRGETALVQLGGELSHAVRKRPRRGDFRVQPRWGGTAVATEPSAAEVAVAGLALAALPEAPLYARVDLVEGPEGEPCLIELELIEPNLFLAEAPGAAEALAARVEAALAG